jgi:hypothetical protein
MATLKYFAGSRGEWLGSGMYRWGRPWGVITYQLRGGEVFIQELEVFGVVLPR